MPYYLVDCKYCWCFYLVNKIRTHPRYCIACSSPVKFKRKWKNPIIKYIESFGKKDILHSALQRLVPIKCIDCVCVVCRENMELGLKLICGHKFHYECISKWVRISDTCPTCRTRLYDSLKSILTKEVIEEFKSNDVLSLYYSRYGIEY